MDASVKLVISLINVVFYDEKKKNNIFRRCFNFPFVKGLGQQLTLDVFETYTTFLLDSIKA